QGAAGRRFLESDVAGQLRAGSQVTLVGRNTLGAQVVHGLLERGIRVRIPDVGASLAARLLAVETIVAAGSDRDARGGEPRHGRLPCDGLLVDRRGNAIGNWTAAAGLPASGSPADNTAVLTDLFTRQLETFQP